MFVTRQDGLENSLCKHDSTQTTAMNSSTNIVVPAGSILVITGCDGETSVVKKMESCDEIPFGFSMQEIISEYDRRYVPWGGVMDRDRGTMREFVGGPLGVAHNGLYSTDMYSLQSSTISAGSLLYATASGTLTVSGGSGYCDSGWNSTHPVAQAMNELTVAHQNEGRYLHIKGLI
jgi:hypothetical protein